MLIIFCASKPCRTQSPKTLKQKYKKSNTYNTIKKKSKKNCVKLVSNKNITNFAYIIKTKKI